MIIDAEFIFEVAKLAIKFGTQVIVPIIEACHKDKTNEQKTQAKSSIEYLVGTHAQLPKPIQTQTKGDQHV